MPKLRTNPKTYSCQVCGNESTYRASKNNLYCSVACQQRQQYLNYIEKWLSGEVPGGGPQGTSRHLKRYLLEKQEGKCSECGIVDYNGKPITLEVEHIDGDYTNNHESNLKMICPNCHSQTDTYRAKNKGKGRHYRRERYAAGLSF